MAAKSSIYIGSKILVTIQWVLGRWEVFVDFLMIFVGSLESMRHSLATLRVVCRRHRKTTFIQSQCLQDILDIDQDGTGVST